MRIKELRKLGFCLLMLVVLVLTGCGGEEQISRDYLCRFAFNTLFHPTSKIVTAVTAPGYFVWIEMERKNGIWHVKVHPADQSGDEDIALTTDEENYVTYELGAYNGIILGSTNFNGPIAFDRQCPNCLQNTGMFNSPLTWSKKTMEVECDRCDHSYSLETGANLQGGPRLMQYAVSVNANNITVMN